MVAAQPKAYDDYETLIKGLGSELRAAPSDRLKTDEELVVAESRRLERLEGERLERMAPDGERERAKGRSAKTDDDLVTDYVVEERRGGVNGEEGSEEGREKGGRRER